MLLRRIDYPPQCCHRLAPFPRSHNAVAAVLTLACCPIVTQTIARVCIDTHHFLTPYNPWLAPILVFVPVAHRQPTWHPLFHSACARPVLVFTDSLLRALLPDFARLDTVYTATDDIPA